MLRWGRAPVLKPVVGNVVVDHSAKIKAGLISRGDTITAINGKPIVNRFYDRFFLAVKNKALRNRELEVGYRRGGSRRPPSVMPALG
jgi:S1-C subfamily serine protease